MTYYTIHGNVRDQHGNAVTGVSVIARNQPGGYRQFSYSDQVDSQGHYHFDFSSNTAAWLYTDQYGYYVNSLAFLFLVQDAQGNEIGRRDRVITWSEFCYGATVDIDIVIDEDKDTVCPGCVPCEYRVSGWLREPNGQPIGGAQVTVYKQGFRTRDGLSSAVTDSYGNYSMVYETDEDCRLEGPGIELSVEAKQGSTVLANSGVICDPPRHVVVNLVRDGAEDVSSEYDRVAAALRPHMEGQGFSVLVEEDVEFLACRSAIAEELVARFINAWLLSAQRPLHVAPEPEELGPHAYYAWLRGDAGDTLDDLRKLSIQALVDGQQLGEDEGWVPKRNDADVPSRRQIAIRLRGGIAGDVWDAANPFLYEVLTYNGLLSSSQAKGFIRDHAQHVGTPEEFWAAQINALGPAGPVGHGNTRAAQVQFRLGVGPPLGWHLPLMSRVESVSTPALEIASDVTKLSETVWRGFLDDPHPAQQPVGVPDDFAVETSDEESRRDQFARFVVRNIEEAYFNKYLAYRLKDDGGVFDLAEPISFDAVGDFLITLLDDPEFDLRLTRIPEYFRQNYTPPTGEQEALALAIVQRLLTLAPAVDRYETFKILFEAGYRAASEIAVSGFDEFLERIPDSDTEDDVPADALRDPMLVAITGDPTAGAAQRAQGIYRRARAVYDTISGIATMASGSLNPAIRTVNNPNATAPFRRSNGARGQSPGTGQQGDALEEALISIFGGFDSCSCQHCRSVLSPAAYFVHLLWKTRRQRRWVRRHRAKHWEIENQLA